MFYLFDTENKLWVTLSFTHLLMELNRDRSDDWSDYTMDSTLKEIEEGINNFTEYRTKV